jgi:hypothetical protein
MFKLQLWQAVPGTAPSQKSRRAGYGLMRAGCAHASPTMSIFLVTLPPRLAVAKAVAP